MKKTFYIFLISLFINHFTQAQGVWTAQKANAWYSKQPWFVGANYLNRSAINQLEMFQADSFDTTQINQELKWARAIGMNTMRVFLHDLLYKDDPEGFLKRMDIFLGIAQRNKISILFVLFDSCWEPYPQSGKQRSPKPHVHNSGWVQSPGRLSLENPADYPRLETYTKAVIKRFANDKRIWGWDVWNEPDNTNNSSYGKLEPPQKVALVTALLPQVFAWVRSQNPTQPVTSGVWAGDWSSNEKLKPIEKIQLENSDVITFHSYENEENFEKRIKFLQRYNRPMICTEYMSRGNNCSFNGTLPICKKYKVGAINWGLVSGKSQTIYPWDTWDRTYTGEPMLWFHDVFKPDGKPYNRYEVEFIKQITKK
jgi:hypothetical protein